MDSQSKHIFFVFVLFLLNVSVRFMHVFVLFTYCGVCWVFVAARGLSLVAVSRGYSPVCGARASHGSGFSCWGAWSQELPASVAATHRPAIAQGLGCPTAAESSLTRDQTRVPCTGRWIRIHRTTKEVFICVFKCINS